MNKEEIDEAIVRFGCGCNCCQTILLIYNNEFGLSNELALKLGTGFGGGFARQGETCGAVTGAIMVIGLIHGRSQEEDDSSSEKTYEIVQKFLKKFKEQNKSLECRELLDCAIITPEEREYAKNKGILKRCPEFVRSAAEILEEII
jgi:C_GCAxxG_C_C family probable redox protein